MANEKHVAQLKKGVDAWNAWRSENPDVACPDLEGADLHEANLTEAHLSFANLVQADLTGADLTGCRIYGVSAWSPILSKDTKQKNLIITRGGEPGVPEITVPEITVDDIEVAQLVHLLLHNQKIRDVFDTITPKAVL